MKIKVKIMNNAIEFQESEKIDELQKEVNYLKELLNLKRNGNPKDVHRQLYILKKENSKLRKIASNNTILSKNILPGSSYNSLVSTARGVDRQDYLDTFDTKKLQFLDSSKEIQQNNRYGAVAADQISFPPGSKMKNYDEKNKPILAGTTSFSSNIQGRLSREGRSSTDLQYAGAKILAGIYSKNSGTNGSMGREDDIPVRIRSHKKMGRNFNFILF